VQSIALIISFKGYGPFFTKNWLETILFYI